MTTEQAKNVQKWLEARGADAESYDDAAYAVATAFFDSAPTLAELNALATLAGADLVNAAIDNLARGNHDT